MIDWLDSCIIFEDESIIVIDKPAGLFVHRNSYEPDAPNFVDLFEKRYAHRLFTVHRLDKATGGLLLLAKTSETAGIISEQFRNGTVRKRYRAVVRGHVISNLDIIKDVRDVSSKVRYAAHSIIHPVARVILPERSDKYEESWYSLIEIELLTGRRHQARSHCAWISHPIVGDTAHGDKVQNLFFRTRFDSTQMFLQSMFLSFTHPSTGCPIHFTRNLPEAWTPILLQLGFDMENINRNSFEFAGNAS